MKNSFIVKATLIQVAFIFFTEGYSQTKQLSQIFLGRVIDTNAEPIPYAHLHFENSNQGTITNLSGDFRLVSKAGVSKSVIVSAIGFKPRKVVLNEHRIDIILEEDILELAEVTILPRDYARELVEKAIAEIPNNYPEIAERHTGFVRESTVWENQPEPIYIVESVIEAIKDPYDSKNNKGHITLLESRTYSNEQFDSLNTRVFASAHHIHRFDIVSRREEFLSKPNSFNFEIEDTTRLNSQNVFKISFNRKNQLSGFIYIMDSSFAITKAEFNYQDFFPLSLRNRNRVFVNYTVTYQQSTHKRWRFKQSTYETAFKKSNRLLRLSSEYVSTDISKNQEEISYLDRIQYGDILLTESGEYSPDFWRDYTIILPDPEIENLFKSTNPQLTTNYEKNSNRKLVTFLTQLRLGTALTTAPIELQGYSLKYANTVLELDRNEMINKSSAWALSTRFHYPVTPNLFLGLVLDASIFNNGVVSSDLSAFREVNLNPNGRPILISPGIRIGYQNLNFFIGNYASEGEFQVNGKSFDSGKTDISIQQRGLKLFPSLSLGYVKNNRLQFFVEMGYAILVENKVGLVFDETDQFFAKQKKTFLMNGAEGLSISSTSPLFNNFWMITIGIYFGP